MEDLLYKELSYTVRGIAFDIYKEFHNRHKERVYHNAFIHALREKNISFEAEERIPVMYRGRHVGVYIPDIVIDEKIIIEIKAKSALTQQDISQFWYYLRGTPYRLGFLINFGRSKGVHIIRRVYDTARTKQK